MPWTDYADDIEFHFNPSVTSPEANEPAERERAALSAAARANLERKADLRYGPGPRHVLDFFPARGAPRAIHVYLHGGYWRRGDKDVSSFAAAPTVKRGIPTAVMSYPLCPNASLDEITRDVMDGLAWIASHAGELGVPGARLFVSGHSAGAHLAATAMNEDWERHGLPADTLIGVCLVSGIYDLGPVPRLSVNELIRLDPRRVHDLSPMFHPPRRPVPVIIAVGGAESPGWIAQTDDFEAVCRTAGCEVARIAFPGMSHYNVRTAAHGVADSPVVAAIAAQIARAG